MKTIWNPFETNLNWNMRDFEKNKLKGIILENLIYTLEKTYRNGNDMICSIDINGKKIERQFWKWTWNSESVKPLSQSKCFTCLKPTTAETQYSRQFWAKIWFFEYGKNWQLMKKKKKNLNKNFGKCVNKKVHWTLETYVHMNCHLKNISIHFGNTFRKVFGSARLEYYRICRCEFITYTQQPHLIF